MSVDRRSFMKTGAAITIGLRGASRMLNARTSRTIGANDRINLGFVGQGAEGTGLARDFSRIGAEAKTCQIVAVCDVYRKRLETAKARHKCDGYLDYRELLNRDDVDAVVVATPDHWHARISLEAMAAGKDVYVEKPMCHTIDEARQLVEAVKKNGSVLQVGSQTTSADQWHKAKKAIADGMIGRMIMSQGSFHRNSTRGEWNYTIDTGAGPDGTGEQYIDWKMWLGPAPKRPYDPERFFRFRKFWDYSGGIATDLFYHVIAPMNICWGEPQFPYKVMAGGGIYVFKDREVPDTFHLVGEYKQGHSIVLSSSMANSEHIPGLIRGHEGTLIMVEHGQFERYTPYITVRPEAKVIDGNYKAKWGEAEIKIPVLKDDVMGKHILNFLECIRTRAKPTLDVYTGACAQVLVSMSVQSYREGRTLYFDEKSWKVLPKAPRA